MAALRRSSDDEPGLARRRRGRGWSYTDHRGRPVEPRVRARIEALVIPPAWREVWICGSSRGHIQATGVDAAGRKQYLYHPAWTEERDRDKHERILRFGDGLPAFRRVVGRHLRRRRLDREKALAAAAQLLDRTALRVGSEEYAAANGSYGIATMRSRHLEVEGDTLVLDFVGKSGKDQHVSLRDARLAAVLAEMDDLPGYEVLKYRDDAGGLADVRSEDVNAYVKEHLGAEFSSKDFRTWAATVAAAVAVDELNPAPASTSARTRALAGVCRAVAGLLGNTPAVVRASYIDPRVFDHFEDGVTISALAEEVRAAAEGGGLSGEERAVLALLRRRLG